MALAGPLLCASAALCQHGGGSAMGGVGLSGGMGQLSVGASVGAMEGPQSGTQGGAAQSNGSVPMGSHLMSVPTHPTGLHLGLAGRWWDERSSIKALGLRKDQKQRMDAIFDGSKGTLLTSLDNVKQAEDKLASLSQKERQDEPTVMAAMRRVQDARAELARQTIHMQVQIRQQLDQDQLDKLDTAIAGQH